jgi:N-acyl-L-homoserine lactone synthetase
MISNSSKINQEVVPQIKGDFFLDNPESRFAFAVLDGSDVVSNDRTRLARAYLRLRANVYIDQIGVLGSEQRLSGGIEIDDDDERSTHFVLIENLIGKIAIFGSMRLIEKSAKHSANLPIENFYPESFSEPVSNGGIEVSRFIVRHNDPTQRAYSKLNLIRTGLAHTLQHNLGPVYATVETELERDLRSVGVPTKKVTPLKYIEEYNTSNFGIEIDKLRLKKSISEETATGPAITKGAVGGFWGIVETREEDLRIA